MDEKSKNSLQSSALQDRMKLVNACPLCQQEFSEEAIIVVEKSNDSELIHVTCPRCLNALLALVMASPVGLGSIVVVTDLNAKDAIRLRGKQIISEDDVLNFYKFVENSKITKEFIKR